tara:strand:+ start:142 stop:336 length:195 start_codon:yes stop_codon:yes gene_type:complete
MPTISGRWVPDTHSDAVTAAATPATPEIEETAAPADAPNKKATRTRGRRKVETAMVDPDPGGTN